MTLVSKGQWCNRISKIVSTVTQEIPAIKSNKTPCIFCQDRVCKPPKQFIKYGTSSSCFARIFIVDLMPLPKCIHGSG